MLTQIEIDGFKTFKDFKVELAPFQVIVGPNGSGKSNLFDALQLLSRLAEMDLRTAFQGLRGDPDELFTKLSNRQRTSRIRMAVEMLVDRKVQDTGGGEIELIREKVGLRKEVTLKYTRLRYELEITLERDENGLDQFHIAHEALKSIPQEEDKWCKKYGTALLNKWLSQPTGDRAIFIDTKFAPVAILESVVDKSTATVEHLMIHLYPTELYPGESLYPSEHLYPGGIRRFSAGEVQRTILSRIVDTEYPYVFATGEELRSLRFFHLNPDVLRQPSSTKAPQDLSSDGGNLPTALARMQAEDKFALTDISRDMANLVPDLTGIELKKDEVRSEYTVWANYQDGHSFSSRVLSDGTLQLLALATLKNDQQLQGVLCFEEPENGVNPAYLKDIAHLLRGLATDFADPKQADEPLRQVLITSHSPAFISLPEVVDFLLFAFMVTLVEPRKYSVEVTRMIPVVPANGQENQNVDIDKAEKSYTLHQIEKYLDSKYLDEARTKFGRG